MRHKDEVAGRRLPPGLPPVADVTTAAGIESERRLLERLWLEGVIGEHALRTGLAGLGMLERSLARVEHARRRFGGKADA